MTDATTAELDRLHHLHPFTDWHQHRQQGGRIITRAEHVWIEDSTGHRMLDAMSGLWCCSLGYSQPRIVEAIRAQLEILPYYNNFFRCSNQPAAELAARLAALWPGDLDRVFFTNSGSEANDTALRMIQRYHDLRGEPERRIVISRRNAYHGSTIAAASLGGMAPMHAQQRGLDYVCHIAQPYHFAEGGDLDPESFGRHAARDLERTVDRLGPERIAAFIAEPIQGAGGVIIPPESYWPTVQAILQERSIPFIVDEVICGFGRTGYWFGSEGYELRPDLMVFAKAVTNGFQPLGGVRVGPRVGEVLLGGGGEFAHGLTYSGHPAACAAALATLDILEHDGIVENTRERLAPYFAESLGRLRGHRIVGEVRTRGMLGAVELATRPGGRERIAADSAAAVFCRDRANDAGLMVRQTADAMIMAPPLILDKEEVDLIVERLRLALDTTARHYGL